MEPLAEAMTATGGNERGLEQASFWLDDPEWSSRAFSYKIMVDFFESVIDPDSPQSVNAMIGDRGQMPWQRDSAWALVAINEIALQIERGLGLTDGQWIHLFHALYQLDPVDPKESQRIHIWVLRLLKSWGDPDRLLYCDRIGMALAEYYEGKLDYSTALRQIQDCVARLSALPPGKRQRERI